MFGCELYESKGGSTSSKWRHLGKQTVNKTQDKADCTYEYQGTCVCAGNSANSLLDTL